MPLIPKTAGLETRVWRTRSMEERRVILQQLETALAAQEGRTPSAVRLFHGEPNERGEFESWRNTIWINQALINPEEEQRAFYGDDGAFVDPNEPYMAVNTLLHEDRHAHQDYVAEQRPDLAESSGQLDDFQKNRGAGYFHSGLRYRAQPVEVDARQFAAKGTDELYGKEMAYQAHRDHIQREEAAITRDVSMFLEGGYEQVRQEAYANYDAALAQEQSSALVKAAAREPGARLQKMPAKGVTGEASTTLRDPRQERKASSVDGQVAESDIQDDEGTTNRAQDHGYYNGIGF